MTREEIGCAIVAVIIIMVLWGFRIFVKQIDDELKDFGIK